jgi:hypothetical protein
LRLFQSSLEIEIISPTNQLSLVVPRYRESETQFVRGRFGDRDEEASVELEAIGREGIDLVGRVEASAKTFACSTIRVTPDHDDLAIATCPLALNPPELRVKVEDHVVSPALGDRLVDIDPQLRGGQLYG